MDRHRNDKEVKSSQVGWTFWLLTACITVTASASFGYGYGVGAPNMYIKFTEPFLRKKYDICDVDDKVLREKQQCTDALIFANNSKTTDTNVFVTELYNGLPQTLYIIGCFIGSLTGSWWSRLGRTCDRKKVFYINFPFIYLSSIFMLICYYCKVQFLFYLSRILHGYQSGMACCIVPPYVNEISSQKVRGSAGVFHQFFVTVGILIAQVIGLPVILGRFSTWVWGLSIVFIPCVIASVIIPFIPNSPSQLYLTYHDETEAKKALRKLRNMENCDDEIECLKKLKTESTTSSSLTMKEIFTRKDLRWQLITSLALLGVQALSGVNAVFFYSSKIFKTAGISDEYLAYATLVTGFINVLMTIAVIPLIERLGRKPLLVYPMSAMLMIFIFMTLFIQLNEKSPKPAYGYVCVILTLLFICCFAVGLGPIAFIYPNEILRQEARDPILSLGLCINYAGNLLLSLFFPPINAALKGYVFLIFFFVVLFGVVLLWIKMPETKNKSIEEIEAFWGIHADVTDASVKRPLFDAKKALKSVFKNGAVVLYKVLKLFS